MWKDNEVKALDTRFGFIGSLPEVVKEFEPGERSMCYWDLDFCLSSKEVWIFHIFFVTINRKSIQNKINPYHLSISLKVENLLLYIENIGNAL